jgi:hypothetical protein
MTLICVTVALLIAAVASQPSDIATISRAGRQAEIRFISQLSNLGADFLIQNQPYGGVVVANVKVGATILDTTTVSANSEQRTYKIVDTGASGQATVELTVSGTGVSPFSPVTVQCSTGIVQGERVTFVLTQTVTPLSLVTGGCQVTTPSGAVSGTCVTTTTNTKGSVNVLCNGIAEKLSDARSCTQVPVRFYSKTAACPVTIQLSLTGKKTATQETTLLVPVPATFGTNVLQLDRSVALDIKGVPLFAAGTPARFISAFISEAGVLTVDPPLETAFLNVVNLAYRSTTPAGSSVAQRDNTFTIVITRGPSLVAQAVVHFQQSVAAQTAMGWIEVPAGSPYTLHVFDDSVTSFDQVFGNTALSITAISPITGLTGSTPSDLTANEMRIFRIQDTQVTNVPLGPSTKIDSTKFVVWNHLPVAVKLASPTADCCNFLDDTRSGNPNTLAQGGGVILPAPRDQTALTAFNVFSSSSTCQALGSPVISTSIALTDVAAASECAVQGLFIVGRQSVAFSTVSCATSSVQGVVGSQTCSNPTTSSSTRIVSLLGAPDDINEASAVVTIPAIRFCNCNVLEVPCSAEGDKVLDCKQQKQVDLLTAAIASSGSSINVNTNNRATAVLNAVKGVANDIDDVADDIDDVADELEDVADDIEDVADDVEDLL